MADVVDAGLLGCPVVLPDENDEDQSGAGRRPGCIVRQRYNSCRQLTGYDQRRDDQHREPYQRPAADQGI